MDINGKETYAYKKGSKSCNSLWAFWVYKNNNRNVNLTHIDVCVGQLFQDDRQNQILEELLASISSSDVDVG